MRLEGKGLAGSELGAHGPASLPTSAQAEDPTGVCLLAPQLAEVLSRCSQNITETQESLSSLSQELVKSRDQVHEDRRSVGFSFFVGWEWGSGQHQRSSSL